MANKTNNSGVGFMGLLTIVFITLKLIGIINWSWWWVLSPIFLLMLIIIAFISLIIILEVTNGR